MARKVINYRRDQLRADIIEQIEQERKHLRELAHDKDAQVETVEAARKRLHEILKQHGGKIYPVTFWIENTEMILVAVILAIGIRTFFIQPFKIPTNSMYPTYAGMQAKVYEPNSDQQPGLLGHAFDVITKGASRYTFKAQMPGEVYIPLLEIRQGEGYRYPVIAQDKKLFRPGSILPRIPGVMEAYPLLVIGDERQETITVWVPRDFEMQEVIRQTYFPAAPSLVEAAAARQEELVRVNMPVIDGGGRQQNGRVVLVPTGLDVEAGEQVLSFDIETGDMLFVDRLTYNFFPPDRGDPIVFRTDKIPGLEREIPRGSDNFIAEETYYIKRLAGLPGDTLQIKDYALLVDGEPATGSEIFELNAERVGEYPGYRHSFRLGPGDSFSVPDDYYFVLGDNSPKSYDSRAWGLDPDTGRLRTDLVGGDDTYYYVPDTEVVGKALFIFYPLTSRWGPAK